MARAACRQSLRPPRQLAALCLAAGDQVFAHGLPVPAAGCAYAPVLARGSPPLRGVFHCGWVTNAAEGCS